jgi:hypothetical protein
MHNDSLETLLLRHYGDAAPAPADLEQRLIASVQQAAATHKQSTMQRFYARRLSRRQALRLVFGPMGLQGATAS